MESWLKPCIDMNTELIKKQKMISKMVFKVDAQCSFWKNNGKCWKT